jgi:uncharacterized membrane protein YkoI
MALATAMAAHAQNSDLVQPFAGSRAARPLIDRNSDNPFDRNDVGSARRAGDILPMWEVIHRLGPELRGQVVATDITRRSGQWLYEFQVLRADGRLVRVWADARSGVIVGSGR